MTLLRQIGRQVATGPDRGRLTGVAWRGLQAGRFRSGARQQREDGDVTVECIVPVAINIKRADFPNAINMNGTAPVAVLPTRAGEYGLAFAFDATKVDPLSVHFGPASLVFPETGGATAIHGPGHLEEALELDEKTRDKDLDMVLQFRVADSGLTPASTEACVKGTFTAADGSVHKFFSCDSVKVSP